MVTERPKRFGLTVRSVIYAVGIHILIGIVLFASFSFDSTQVFKVPSAKKVETVQATVMTEAEIEEQMDIIAHKEEEKIREQEKRLEDLLKKSEEAEKKAKVEQKKLADLEKKKEQEKKKAEDKTKADALALKKKEEAKKKKEADKLAKKKKEEERKKAEAEKKKKAELAKKKKAKEDKRKKELAKKKKLEEETRKKELALQKRLDEERTQAALNQYVPIIRQKVGRNWNQPPNVQTGIAAIVAVKLTATGEVISANVTRSSGNSIFDRSVVNAVFKASPLPIPQERGVNEKFRNLSLNFKPEDLI